jgi:hypothetical protein
MYIFRALEVVNLEINSVFCHNDESNKTVIRSMRFDSVTEVIIKISFGICSLLGVYQHFGGSSVTICYIAQCHISLKGWACVGSVQVLECIICSFMYITA